MSTNLQQRDKRQRLPTHQKLWCAEGLNVREEEHCQEHMSLKVLFTKLSVSFDIHLTFAFIVIIMYITNLQVFLLL